MRPRRRVSLTDGRIGHKTNGSKMSSCRNLKRFIGVRKGACSLSVHTHSPSGVETWRAGSSLPCVSSRLLPQLWAGAGVKGHCGWLAFLTYSCLSAHSASLSHEPLLPLSVVIFRSGCTAGSGGHLLNCHTRVAFKNRTTALCEEADTSLEY